MLWSWRKKKKKASEDLATGWTAIKYLGNVRNACTYVKRSCSSVVFEKNVVRKVFFVVVAFEYLKN